MSFENVQSIKLEVKANIEQLQSFKTLLPILQIVRHKNTSQFSLLQETIHKQVVRRISDIERQIEPNLLLLINSEKLLDDAEKMSEEATEESLEELYELTQAIEGVRVALFHAIDSASNRQRYDLRYAYPQYDPVLTKKRGALDAGLGFQNASLHSFSAKKYHQDITESDLDLTCDEDLDEEESVVSFKNKLY